jgi:hypothetical protein
MARVLARGYRRTLEILSKMDRAGETTAADSEMRLQPRRRRILFLSSRRDKGHVIPQRGELLLPEPENYKEQCP